PDLVWAHQQLTAGVPVQVDLRVTFGPARAHSLHFGCRPPSPPDLLERAVAAAKAADAVALVVGENQDSALESADRTSTRLPPEQERLIEQVCAANPRTMVILNAAHATDLACAEQAAALMCVWFPGQEFGPALAAVLAGELEPGGRLPVTFAREERDYPIFDLTPVKHDLVYETEPVIGYRHFNGKGIEPRFAFGEGFGYATFAFEGLRIEGRRLEVTVRNTSERAGKEVVQVYVRPPAGVGTGALELKAFAPIWLGAQTSQLVGLELDDRAVRHWSDGRWQITSGEYEVRVGHSIRDLPLRGGIIVG
ncbi:MAG: glycoside hydrolase family 3 C-terminal domain-containing protein, partial [Acetobacteraceae bacterium]|nr:glycoside hydrolase family 3 C-terminal domain-containing protein [Acetobacteraceae bacterium]